jgi:AcrR family transcriptional regulator
LADLGRANAVTDEPTIDPWRRVADARDRRRFELFLLAAPVFERHGFRGATIRALAHACHLSPAGLYHYFSSKEELATYVLRSPRAGWDETYIQPDADPLLQLRQFLDMAINALPVYMLALRMLDEIGDETGERLRAEAFRDGEATIGRFVHAAAPRLERDAALELSRHIISLLVGSAVSRLDADASTIRRRVVNLLRAELVPAHLAGERLEQAFREWAA